MRLFKREHNFEIKNPSESIFLYQFVKPYVNTTINLRRVWNDFRKFWFLHQRVELEKINSCQFTTTSQSHNTMLFFNTFHKLQKELWLQNLPTLYKKLKIDDTMSAVMMPHKISRSPNQRRIERCNPSLHVHSHSTHSVGFIQKKPRSTLCLAHCVFPSVCFDRQQNLSVCVIWTHR